jgi:hypothetical protein
MAEEKKQLTMLDEFGVEENWKEHWVGMPEYVQKDETPHQQIIVSFRSEQDVKDFAQLIGQKLTYKTKSVWFPPYKLEKPSNFLYINEQQDEQP